MGQILRLIKIYIVVMRNSLDKDLFDFKYLKFIKIFRIFFPNLWFRNNSLSRGERIKNAFEELGPIFVKLGQTISTRKDLLPEDIAEELVKLQDKVTPFSGQEAKKLIEAYFGPIPRGKDIERSFPKEDPITKTITAEATDPNISIPAIIASYITPSMKTRDSRVLDMVSSYLSGGKSSILNKKLVDDKKMALAVQAVNLSQEDYGNYILFALPQGDNTLEGLLKEMDEEIVKIQTELISEKAYQKLQNQFENRYVNSNSSVEGIANSLARYNVLYGDTNLINTEIDIYRSITREEIREVAKKYLNTNQRLILNYLPEKK